MTQLTMRSAALEAQAFMDKAMISGLESDLQESLNQSKHFKENLEKEMALKNQLSKDLETLRAKFMSLNQESQFKITS